MHVVLSECWNGTCASPIDFTGIKLALLCIVTCEAYENAWVRKMEIKIGRHRRLWRLWTRWSAHTDSRGKRWRPTPHALLIQCGTGCRWERFGTGLRGVCVCEFNLGENLNWKWLWALRNSINSVDLKYSGPSLKPFRSFHTGCHWQTRHNLPNRNFPPPRRVWLPSISPWLLPPPVWQTW